MKLSLIIPIYNVEQYVARCLQSCLQQPYLTDEDYELIIVNDGTKDRSMDVVKELICERGNVTIIEQKNQGLSVARNTGLGAAKGEYVWFIDSDDWIEPGCLHQIIGQLEDTKVDIMQLQYRNVYADATPPEEHYSLTTGIQNGKEWFVQNKYHAAVPFMIYRREFLLQHQLSFYPGIYHEDSDFKPRAVYLADTCTTYNKVVYNYFKGNSSSITAVLKLKNGVDLFIVMNNLLQFVVQHKIEGVYKRSFYTQIGIAMKTVLRTLYSVSGDDYTTLKGMMKDNRHLFACMCRANNFKMQLCGLLLYTNLSLGIKVYRLLV